MATGGGIYASGVCRPRRSSFSASPSMRPTPTCTRLARVVISRRTQSWRDHGRDHGSAEALRGPGRAGLQSRRADPGRGTGTRRRDKQKFVDSEGMTRLNCYKAFLRFHVGWRRSATHGPSRFTGLRVAELGCECPLRVAYGGSFGVPRTAVVGGKPSSCAEVHQRKSRSLRDRLSRRLRRGGFSSPAAGVYSPRRRTGDAGIPGGEDRRRRIFRRPRLGAGSGPEAVQGRRPGSGSSGTRRE